MSIKAIKPLGNRVLVKRSQARTTRGGILLPETAKETSEQGEIIAVGPGKRDEEGQLQLMNIKVGDQILFGRYAGSEVPSDGIESEYLILAEEDVLGVINQQ